MQVNIKELQEMEIKALNIVNNVINQMGYLDKEKRELVPLIAREIFCNEIINHSENFPYEIFDVIRGKEKIFTRELKKTNEITDKYFKNWCELGTFLDYLEGKTFTFIFHIDGGISIDYSFSRCEEVFKRRELKITISLSPQVD